MITVKGVITEISEELKFKRPQGNITKVNIDIELENGEILFAEIRNHRLKLVDKIVIGESYFIDIVFEGSYKNGRKYNNLTVHNIL